MAVHQMLATIQNDGLIPALVLDDTDRWLSGSAFADHEALARSFLGAVLAALAELRCALMPLHTATVVPMVLSAIDDRGRYHLGYPRLVRGYGRRRVGDGHRRLFRSSGTAQRSGCCRARRARRRRGR